MLETNQNPAKRLSAVIATYKPGDYIWECLDSIVEQTLEHDRYEVIIVLNGPKEPYYGQIADYILEKGIENLKLIYTETRGVSEARNTGMDQSTGGYLTFIDDDDRLHEDYFASLLERAEEDAMVLSDNEYFEDGTNELLDNPRSGAFKPDYETNNMLEFRKFFRIAWGKLVPKSLIGNIRFDPKIQPGEDTLFIMEVLANVKKIKTIEAGCFYYRRIRANSLIAPCKSFADHWKLHSHQIWRHLLLLPRKSSLAHKVVVTASMLGITRYFLKASLQIIFSRSK